MIFVLNHTFLENSSLVLAVIQYSLNQQVIQEMLYSYKLSFISIILLLVVLVSLLEQYTVIMNFLNLLSVCHQVNIEVSRLYSTFHEFIHLENL
jgi:hypothetical protein